MFKLRATSTKKMSRLRESVSLLSQTLMGVCGIRMALVSGLSLMCCLIHATNCAGSCWKRTTSSGVKAFVSKNCLKGLRIISYSTRGESWLLLACMLSSRMTIGISRRSLSVRVLSKSSALCDCWAYFSTKALMVLQLPRAFII